VSRPARKCGGKVVAALRTGLGGFFLSFLPKGGRKPVRGEEIRRPFGWIWRNVARGGGDW
jgi:hypothetical protein